MFRLQFAVNAFFILASGVPKGFQRKGVCKGRGFPPHMYVISPAETSWIIGVGVHVEPLMLHVMGLCFRERF